MKYKKYSAAHNSSDLDVTYPYNALLCLRKKDGILFEK